MKKKYRISYTWHSGECFGARMYGETTVDLEEKDLASFKKVFEEENIDGSYNSIDSIEEINRKENI